MISVSVSVGKVRLVGRARVYSCARACGRGVRGVSVESETGVFRLPVTKSEVSFF